MPNPFDSRASILMPPWKPGAPADLELATVVVIAKIHLLSLSRGARSFHLGGHSPGVLGDGSPPVGSRGEATVGGLEDGPP